MGKGKRNRKTTIEISRMDWNTEYFLDIQTKRGFLITEPATFQDDKKEKSLFGSRSPLFGTTFEDETAYMERHRCKCGMFTSQLFRGETCPICNTVVESKGADIKFTGWISLGYNYIINPYYYNKLLRCVGKKVLPDIIKSKIAVDVNGNTSRINIEDMEETPTSPFYGIGLIEFKERFEEIMEYFQKKKKNKHTEIQRLIDNKLSVFTSKIPVYTTLLRPQSFTSDSYYFNSIDRQINPIFTLSEKLKSAKYIEMVYILSRIQERTNKLWDENFSIIDGKEGFIRDQILGGALNFTARNVIVPDPTLADDEVDLSYHTFLILYAYRIMYYLMKMDDISLSKAYDIWSRAYKFDPRVYEVMCFIIKEENTRVVINRNPTLNYYSIINMKVRQVKIDHSDYNLSVPLSILDGLNADFDGDILNIIALLTEDMKHIFRKFNPVDRMLMSRDTGDLNNYFALNKDTLINLHYWNTL